VVPGRKHEVVGEKRTWKANLTLGEGPTDSAGANYTVVLDMQPLDAVTVAITAVHTRPCVFNKQPGSASPLPACGMRRGNLSEDGTAVGNVAGDDEFVATGDHSTVTIDPATLVFTTANWRQPQLVNIYADDDSIAQGMRSVRVVHSTSSDGDAKYNDTNMAELDVTVVEDDRYGVLPDQPQIAMVEAQSADFTVQLASSPYSDVTVQVAKTRALFLFR
jgi:hypothetical protein